MSRRHFVGSLGLAVLLMGTFLWGTDWEALRDAFRRASWGGLGLGLLAGAGVYVARGVRWAFLLRPLGRVRWTDAVWANVIGFAANTLLPGRVGEVVRALWIRRQYDVPVAHLLATIAVERVVDVGVLVGVVGYFLLVGPSGAWGRIGGLVRTSVLVLGVLVAGVVLLVLGRRRGPAADGRGRCRSWQAAVVRFFDTAAEGVRVVSRPRVLVPYILISVAFWAFDAGALWLGVRPFVPDLSVPGALGLMALVMLGAAVPTPGAVGGFHWGVRLALTEFYNIGATAAVSAGVWAHFCAFFPAVSLAVGYLAVRGLAGPHIRELLGPTVNRREVSPLSE